MICPFGCPLANSYCSFKFATENEKKEGRKKGREERRERRERERELLFGINPNFGFQSDQAKRLNE